VRRAGRGFDGGKPAGQSELGDLLYSEQIGAYSHASSTYFNGFPPATVVHVNQ
jgi:diaminopimelate decarboxylase